MSAYVILTHSEKWGTLSPTIIGPFADEATAQEFVSQDEETGRMIERVQRDTLDTEGGYAGTIIVCEATADGPDEWMDAHADVFGDEDNMPITQDELIDLYPSAIVVRDSKVSPSNPAQGSSNPRRIT
jgi:hypothetical protein